MIKKKLGTCRNLETEGNQIVIFHWKIISNVINNEFIFILYFLELKISNFKVSYIRSKELEIQSGVEETFLRRTSTHYIRVGNLHFYNQGNFYLIVRRTQLASDEQFNYTEYSKMGCTQFTR